MSLKEKNILKYRLYHLVAYFLSPIQKGIQAYHSAIEYSLKYGKTADYLQWAKKDKTVVLLNGGSSNSQGFDYYEKTEYLGTMQSHAKALKENKIKFAEFYEPDCNNALTSIAFLVPEKVWNRKDYPDLDSVKDASMVEGILKVQNNNNLIKKYKYTKEEIFLKEFLNQFNLAN